MSADMPADLERAQWLLMTAKAEASDALYRSESAGRFAGWAFVGLVLSVVALVVNVAVSVLL